MTGLTAPLMTTFVFCQHLMLHLMVHCRQLLCYAAHKFNCVTASNGASTSVLPVTCYILYTAMQVASVHSCLWSSCSTFACQSSIACFLCMYRQYKYAPLISLLSCSFTCQMWQLFATNLAVSQTGVCLMLMHEMHVT